MKLTRFYHMMFGANVNEQNKSLKALFFMLTFTVV